MGVSTIGLPVGQGPVGAVQLGAVLPLEGVLAGGLLVELDPQSGALRGQQLAGLKGTWTGNTSYMTGGPTRHISWTPKLSVARSRCRQAAAKWSTETRTAAAELANTTNPFVHIYLY